MKLYNVMMCHIDLFIGKRTSEEKNCCKWSQSCKVCDRYFIHDAYACV